MGVNFATKIQGPFTVIGDLHGQIDQLEAVLDRLATRADFEQRWLVFIGDFVDRGPDPKGTIDMVLRLMKQHPRTTAVAGNHEFAMGGALGWYPVPDYAQWGTRWIEHYNSETTFASYNVPHGDLEALQQAIPPRHKEFITNLPWLVEHPQFLCVHAGLDPNAPTDMQLRILRQRDFTLNRPQWLCSKSFVEADPPADCPATVVSGHVRVPAVVMRPKRILLDTTGGTEGDLSAVLLPERKVITSAGEAVPVGAGAAAGDAKPSWWKFW